MRLWVALIMIMCLCAATAAQAGPWLRKKGSLFTSISVTGTAMGDFGNSTYLEYGWRDAMTIGLDASLNNNRLGERSGFGTVFLRRALGPNKGKNRWAYELGVGSAWVSELMLPHVKGGVSWGRGIEMWDRNGWMTVDASIRWDVSGDAHLTKVDTTVGLNFTDVTTGMVQLYLSRQNSNIFATFAPSVVIKPRKAKFRIQFGSEIPMDNVENAALKLGIWREF